MTVQEMPYHPPALGVFEQLTLCVTLFFVYLGNFYFLINFTRYIANSYLVWQGVSNISDQPVGQFLFEAIYWSDAVVMLVLGLLAQALTHLLWLLVVEKEWNNFSSQFCRAVLYRGFLMVGFFLLYNAIFLFSLDSADSQHLRGNLLESLFGPRTEDTRELYDSLPQRTDTAWVLWPFWFSLFLLSLSLVFRRITAELIGCMVFALPLAFAPQILHRASTLEVLGLMHSHEYGGFLAGLSSVLLVAPTTIFLISRLLERERKLKLL